MVAGSNAGAVIQMTLSGAAPTAPGQHLELWARDAYNDSIRVSGIDDVTDENQITTRYSPFGFSIRPAITMDDPCMIDAAGHLLVTAAAYSPDVEGGVPQSPEEQAQQVRARIAQLVSGSSCDGSGLDPTYHCGRQAATLLGVIADQLVDEAGNLMSEAPAPPTIPFDAAPEDRLALCQAYWSTSVLAYTPNPSQLTAPLHGQLLGNISYQTTDPPSNYDGIRIDTNVGLKGIQELWITSERSVVDPNRRGPIFVRGTPDQGGRGVVHFDLSPPLGSTLAVSGTAALYVDLDQDPVQF
jgi:hypothetical protein